MERLGILGGTFDPPHLGHLILACEAADQLNLARVLWVLTPQPPHKTERQISPLADRLAMLRQAIAAYPQFELSLVEVERPGPHYTVDTMRLLAQTHPDQELIYLIGGDSLRDLPSWSRPLEFLGQLAGLGVLRRPGASFDLEALEAALPGLMQKLLWVDAPQIEIAASHIRELAHRNGPYRCYLPPAVADYVAERRLYD